MLSPNDLIHLPYTPDMTQAGITYACRSLPHTYDRMGGSQAERLRRIVAGKAAEIAFRRSLSERQVPHDNLGATPFTDPDRYDIAIGGRRCDLKSFQIFNKERIRRIRKDPGDLLQASALVPADQFESEAMGDVDIYVFAFVTALVTRDRLDLQRALAARQPVFLIHPTPKAWNQPARWESLGPLALKSEANEVVAIEIGGQGSRQEFQTEELLLPPIAWQPVKQDYYSLAYLRLSDRAGGKIEVRSQRIKETLVILAGDWENIWVYGMDVFLTGYMTRGEYRRQARLLPPNSQVFQYPRTRIANLALPISDLHPLGSLFTRAREWKGD